MLNKRPLALIDIALGVIAAACIDPARLRRIARRYCIRLRHTYRHFIGGSTKTSISITGIGRIG
jgi:hypothetical protein